MVIGDSQDNRQRLVLGRDKTKEIYGILKALSFRDHATLIFDKGGMKATVEDMKSIQATAYIKASIFTRYSIAEDDEIVIKVPLNLLCECLNLFGTRDATNTIMKMSYAGPGAPLQIVLEESSVRTDCDLKTQEPEEILDFDFRGEQIISRVIIQCEAFKDAFLDMESASDYLELTVTLAGPPKRTPTQQSRKSKENPELVTIESSIDGSKETSQDHTSEAGETTENPDHDPNNQPKGHPNLRLTTRVDNNETHFDFPSISPVVEKFSTNQKHSFKYRLSLFKRSLKAMQLAKKVSLRTDPRGVLSMQFLIELEDEQVSFIEFFISADVEDELSWIEQENVE